jgi:hypothetical protein
MKLGEGRRTAAKLNKVADNIRDSNSPTRNGGKVLPGVRMFSLRKHESGESSIWSLQDQHHFEA